MKSDTHLRIRYDDNPAVVYRDSLSRGSYWAVHHALVTIAELLDGEGTDPWTFPWWELEYRHIAGVRRAPGLHDPDHPGPQRRVAGGSGHQLAHGLPASAAEPPEELAVVVYFIYGMHWCLNAVAGRRDEGGAVLLRAGEPVAGEERMRALRGLIGERGRRVRPGDVAGGPGRLCHALCVDRASDGVPLFRGPLRILAGEPVPDAAVAAGPRIGVAYAGEAARWPLRFAVAGDPHVSRPRL